MDESEDGEERLSGLVEVARAVATNPSSRRGEVLDALSDEGKIRLLQQFFRHVADGTHSTDFDQAVVNPLLRRWWGIELAVSDPDGQRLRTVQGCPESAAIVSAPFGDTIALLYACEGKAETAAGLVGTIADRAILTTEKTSPPCSLAEVVPIWLENRDLPHEQIYIRGEEGEDPLGQYFAKQLDLIATHLGVHLEHGSTELALIINGDALRYHRDRLVNQYARLKELPDPDEWMLVQDLTLIDWDMQPGTFSGTAFDHPRGDRFISALYPGQVVSMFFVEPVHPPGPMMMPYHCALPVLDREASTTVGPARGKRLSALTRGLARKSEVQDLINRTNRINIDSPSEDDHAGVQLIMRGPAPSTTLNPSQVIDGGLEGLVIHRLSSAANMSLLRHVTGKADSGDYLIFRVEKHGEGFSTLSNVLPGLCDAEVVYLLNRSLNGPQPRVSYPVAVSAGHQTGQWIRLVRAEPDDVLRIRGDYITSLRMSPTDDILHRSAPLDSFYPSPTSHRRLIEVLDVVYLSK